MDHDEARSLFSRHAEGDLTAEDKARLEAHLGECSECMEERRMFLETVELVRGLEPEPVPSKFVEGVKLKIKRRNKGAYKRLKEGLPYYFRVPFELFSILMIIILASLILLQGLARRIKPSEDREVKLETPVGHDSGTYPSGRVRRMDLKREVISYRLKLSGRMEDLAAGVVDLAESLGGRVKARQGRALSLALPKASFKRFVQDLLKGQKLRVERVRRFTSGSPSDVDVEIFFER